MIVLLIIGIGLISYYLAIVLGRHTVSFSGPVGLMGTLLTIMSSLEVIGIFHYPFIIKLPLYLLVGHMMIVILGLMRYPQTQQPKKPDIIFVFGAGLFGNRLSLSLKVRLETACQLSKSYPTIPVVVAGGQGKDEWISEAQAMKDYLLQKGIDEKLIWMEDRSTTTQENLVYACQLYDLKNKQLALVSNQFHVYRTVQMAKKLGLDGFGYPAYMKNIGVPAFYIREYFACVKAFIKREI